MSSPMAIKIATGLTLALALGGCATQAVVQASTMAESWKDSTRDLVVETARSLDLVTCGGRGPRWAVRVGADPLAWRIDLNQVRQAAPADLERLEFQAQRDFPLEPRARSGPEFDVYQVKGYLLHIENMDDGDLHLTIADSPGPSERIMRGLAVSILTAEAPHPSCVAGRNGQVEGPSRFAAQLAGVRDQLVAALPDPDEATFEPGLPIEVVGIPLMDQERARRLTELELHPLLSVRFGR